MQSAILDSFPRAAARMSYRENVFLFAEAEIETWDATRFRFCNHHVHRHDPRESTSFLPFVPIVSLTYWDGQNVEFLNNPARFLDPYHFRVTFECIAPLEDGAFPHFLRARIFPPFQPVREELTDPSYKE
jgi:hypothetical protein